MDRLFIPTAAALAALLGGAAAVTHTAPRAAGRDTIPPALSPFGMEHEALLMKFDAVLQRAVAPAPTRAEREQFVDYLRTAVIPHAQMEERVLYPALESVLGTRGYATATMVLDHRAIARLTVELAALADPEAFQRKALAVAALVEHHFAKEEDFVLPNLARRMNDRDLRALLARMDAERIAP
jgi:iron-sulfur cluster repair protein YtfE (RIC family)